MEDIEALNEYCSQSMIGFLGIKFTEVKPGMIKANMPVSSKTCQPNGLLHGGASLVLAESMAGAASYLTVDRENYNVLGLQVSGNHISTVSKGTLFAEAQLLHAGKTTHVWEVKITGENDKLISVVRVTNIIAAKKKD